jgi:myo-inositol-1(or 4)-monophosphatase
MSVPNELRTLALAAAGAAGTVLMKRFRSVDLEVREKSSALDVVTDADLAAEQAIVDVIMAARPDDGVVGEEGPGRASRSGLTWVIDPLDSTANFVRGIPIWSISIAARASQMMVGVVSTPQLGEVFSTDGRVVRTNDAVVVPVTATPSLAEATGLGGWGAAQGRERLAGALAELTATAGRMRLPGSPALGLAWTAVGRADFAFYEQNLHEWDMAAGLLMCRTQGLTTRVEEREGRARRLLVAQPSLFAELEAIVFGAD